MENKTLGQLLKGKTSGVFVNDKDEHCYVGSYYIVSAESEEEAKIILHKDHTGNGNKLCNWSKTTKNDCQKKCQLNLKKK